MRISRLVYLLFCLGIAFLLPGTARAQVTLVSTFSSTANGGLGFGYFPTPPNGALENIVLASSFTVPGGPLSGLYTLAQIDVEIGELGNLSGPDVPPFIFQVQLTADNSDSPGEVLESWTVSSSNFNSQIYTVLAGIYLPLAAGHRYWVTVGSAGISLGTGYWANGLPGTNFATGSNINGTGFYITQGQSLAFDVKAQSLLYPGPPFGLGYNQILHIVAGPITPAPGTPVEANISFTDINGNVIGPSSVVTVNPGQVASFDLLANNSIRPGQRIEVVPVVTPGPDPNGAPTNRIEVSAEVRDAFLGLGTVLIPLPTSPPNPTAPGLVTQGLAGGQTMRLSLQASPPQPCIAVVSFADSNGKALGSSQEVNLDPGTGMSVDLTAETAGLKIGQQMDVQAVVTLTPPITAGPPVTPLCQATVETFDQLTGRTATYQTAPVQMPAVP